MGSCWLLPMPLPQARAVSLARWMQQLHRAVNAVEVDDPATGRAQMEDGGLEDGGLEDGGLEVDGHDGDATEGHLGAGGDAYRDINDMDVLIRNALAVGKRARSEIATGGGGGKKAKSGQQKGKGQRKGKSKLGVKCAEEALAAAVEAAEYAGVVVSTLSKAKAPAPQLKKATRDLQASEAKVKEARMLLAKAQKAEQATRSGPCGEGSGECGGDESGEEGSLSDEEETCEEEPSDMVADTSDASSSSGSDNSEQQGGITVARRGGGSSGAGGSGAGGAGAGGSGGLVGAGGVIGRRGSVRSSRGTARGRGGRSGGVRG
ncbi:hypothetical protein PLESTB_001404600 [Pleodorina starrii]|uniref:Uncharacterized protein n=1 Tax=Pleodorina starrii TaxID=330485 RepID=A0A9W6BUU6_9CHLO|nr:hypothetical protein PLESTB_001404600 [Pleodorina starrii]